MFVYQRFVSPDVTCAASEDDTISKDCGTSSDIVQSVTTTEGFWIFPFWILAYEEYLSIGIALTQKTKYASTKMSRATPKP